MQKNVLKVLPVLLALTVTACGAKGRSSSSPIPSDSISTTSESSASTSEHTHTPGSATEENRVEPTCTTDGGYDNVVRCTECHEIISSTHVKLDSLGHDFGEATYEWNSDYTKCTASRVCKRNSEHVETETVNSVYDVIEPNSCGVEGSAKYTATFTNSAFAEQIHNVTLEAYTEHHYIETVVPATDDEEGYTLHECEHCHDFYHTDITSAINKFSYEEYNGGYRITGYTGEAEYFTVPASHNGLPISSVDNVAFQGKDQVKEVVLSEGILGLQGALFQDCANLKKAVIPDSITELGQYLFYRCNSLEEITVPFVGSGRSTHNKTLCTLFGGSTYSNSDKVPASLKKVIIGGACTFVPSYAFYKLSNITSIIIGENVTTIDEYAFGGTGITTLHLPKNVENITARVFEIPNSHSQITSITVDTDNPYFSAEDGVLYNKDKTSLVIYPSKKADTEFVIPDTVKIIGEYAFNDCRNLTSITMSNNVEQLSTYSFAHCSSITSLTLSNKITEIPDSYCIAYCTCLVTVNLPEGLLRIGNYAFNQSSQLANLVIPSSVTSIGAGAFGSTSLATLVFAGSMRDITMDSNWSRNIDNPQISCGGSTTPYGVQVNGGTPVLVERFGFDGYHPEFMQFYVLLDHI